MSEICTYIKIKPFFEDGFFLLSAECYDDSTQNAVEITLYNNKVGS